jgi:hypothetical protein
LNVPRQSLSLTGNVVNEARDITPIQGASWKLKKPSL